MKKQLALLAALAIACGAPAGISSIPVDGKYSIVANRGDVLIVSYIGSKPFEVTVGSGNMDIDMESADQLLDEVVVTALGIKKERKALGYNVTDLKAEELMRNKNTNVINSLAGKVPGVNVTQNSGAAGAGASIIIRGANSTSEGRDNTPLFVVDGIIYDNSTTVLGNSGEDGITRNATTFSNRIMDINPEDIESLTVLKGAAAAALYGSRAADGAIIITTKKGAEGSVRVDYTGKISTSWANKLPEVQKTFGRGVYTTNGSFSDQTYNSWGKPFAAGETIYDNIGNFFKHGIILDNNLSVSGGSKNSTFFLSMSNFDQKGIVPKTGYDKTTIRFNGEQKFNRFTIGANMSYSIAKTDKTLTSGGLWDGGGTGAMNALYAWPLDQEMAHYLNEDGTKYRLFDGVWELANDMENPYWIINKNRMYDKQHRFTGTLHAKFDITDWWNVQGRLGYDNYTTDAYTYIAPGSVVRDIYQNGRLSKADYRYEYLSTNIMTDFHKGFGDWDLGLMLGTSTDDIKRMNQNHWGYDFITAGTISFANIANENQQFRDSNSRKRMVSVFGEARASWRNTLFLTATGRNDWSSTLPINERSYFYPSVSGAFVFTELFPHNDILSFGKIRGSWAQVGKDANVHATMTYLNSPYTYGSMQMVGNSWTQGNFFLKPEIQTAWEVGAELRFLNNRLGLDWTYYHSSTKNQIASPRLSNANGYIFASINSGSVINQGMEISINARPIQSSDFDWDIILNTSYNRGKLGDFLDGVGMFYPTDAQFGTIRSASVPNGGKFMAMVGSRFQYAPLMENGAVVFSDEAKKNPVEDKESGIYAVDPTTGLYYLYSSSNEVVANREPKFIGGLNNIFRIKDFTLSFLLDFRIGGAVYNGTEYCMVGNGLSKLTTLNNRESVTVKGKVWNTGEDFEQTYYADQDYVINGTTYSGRAMIQRYWSNYASNSYNFITDVNWLKLRSVSLTYDLSRLIAHKQNLIKHLAFSVTGTNLFTWTNYKGMDPEVSTAGGTGGSGAVGIDWNSVPAVSSLTFGINVTFGADNVAPARVNTAELDLLNGQINDLRNQLANAQNASNARIAQLENDLAAANRALANCQRDLSAAKNIDPKVIDNSKQFMNVLVHFPVNKTAVTADQRPNVERIAAYMKSHPEATCEIKGYASPEGNQDNNIKLANGRAASVKDMLVNKFGIAANRIKADGQGISNMFDELSWNRVSICEIIVK